MAAPEPEPEGRRSSAPLLWIAAALILAGGAIGTVLALGGGGDEPAAAPSSTAPQEGAVTTTGEAVDGTTGTTEGALPGIDPAIGWRRVDPAQFIEPGEQRMFDVVAVGDLLVAAGRSSTWRAPDAQIPIPVGGGPITVAGWEIVVTAVDMDAAALIAAHDPDNEPAPDGVRYIMVTFEVTNLTEQPTGNVWADVDRIPIGADGAPVGRNAYCGVLPDALLTGPIEAGATHVGTQCIAVLEGEVPQLVGLGFIPAGTERENRDGAVWVSDDGDAWSRPEAPALGGDGWQEIVELTGFGDRIYAVGTDGDDGALWRSGDGRSWERIAVEAFGGPGVQVLTDVEVLDGSLYVIGSDAPVLGPGEDTDAWAPGQRDNYLDRFERRRAALWVSDDGDQWRRVSLGSAGAGLSHLEVAARHNDRTILVGRHIDGDLAVISSPDLSDWRAADLAAVDTRFWRLTGTGAVDGRLHIVGDSGGLWSDDGEIWSIGPTQWAADVVPVGQRLLSVTAFGGITPLGPINVDEHRPALVLIEADGTRGAVPASDLIAEGESGEPFGVASWRDQFVAVGRVTSDNDDAAVWIGGGPEGATTPEIRVFDQMFPDASPAMPAAPTTDLIRFTGSGWELVDAADPVPADFPTGFSAPIVATSLLTIDGTGAPWMASRDGGIYRMAEPGDWTRFDRADGLPSNQVFDLETDSTGTVWACTAGGLAWFDGEQWQAGELPDSITIPQCLDLAAGSDGSMWAATLSGALRWDGTAWTAFTAADGLPSSVITSVLPARNGVWVTTPAGLGYWDGSSWTAFVDADARPAHHGDIYNAMPFASPYDDGIYFAPGARPDVDDFRSDFQRLAPDGERQIYVRDHSFKATCVATDGTVFAGTELSGLYVIEDGPLLVDELAGEAVFRVGELWAAPDGAVWMDSAPGLFELRVGGEVSHHLEVPGLGYVLRASDEVGDFADGTLLAMEFGSDGSTWAVTVDRGGRLGGG